MKRSLSNILLFNLFLLSFACGNDEPLPVKSREVKFEVTGDFSGTIDATYITAQGGATNESLQSLPWTKIINYESTVSGTTITIGGGGGTAGQTLTVKLFAGGSLISETPGVANSSGIIVIASPTYVF
jgi:hypothetical protein